MINVTSTLEKADKTGKCYKSHVTIDGCRSEIICEIKALIVSFLDDSELEDIYLTYATEIAKARVEDLEDLKNHLEDLKND